MLSVYSQPSRLGLLVRGFCTLFSSEGEIEGMNAVKFDRASNVADSDVANPECKLV